MVEKQVRGPAVRGRLVEVADELFTAKGASNVGVDEIVANSGIAKTTLYRWFPAKDDLVVEYLATRDAAFWQVWDEVSARHPDDPHDELVAQLEWIEAYIGSRRFRGCPFLNTTAEFADAEHKVRAAARANKAELRRRLHELAQRQDARDPAALADQLVLIIDGAFATSQVFGRGGPQIHLIDAGRALVAVATETTTRKGRS
jgi:AcrR family transcriptional regulator